MSDYAAIEKEARIFTEECVTNNRIDPELFAQYDIKRGLRDKNGKGVLAGITNISRIDAFEERDGQKIPCEGKLWYRGYNVYDLIRGLRGKRYAFEVQMIDFLPCLLCFESIGTQSADRGCGQT